MKLAIVHDWLNQMGGAEDVLAEFQQLFPQAPIYTSIYARELMPEIMQSWDIRSNWLDHLPGIYRHHQPYLPLYPLGFAQTDLSAYDVILSNKSGFCHGVQRRSDAAHICYCLTPTRYVWLASHYLAREGMGIAARLALKPLNAWLKHWDYAAAQRVTHFIAISTEIQERIRRIYHRQSTLIFPPVDTERFHINQRPPEPFFLSLGRLIPYKRVDLAIEACNRIDARLLIAGAGRDQGRLRALAGPTIEFLGRVSDTEAADLMARCQAFLFPGREDFGITPLQAQAAGRPVIAFAGGGALDTVVPGRTGELFYEQRVDALAEILVQFDPDHYDPTVCRHNALRFNRQRFHQEITDYIARVQEESEPPSAYLPPA